MAGATSNFFPTTVFPPQIDNFLSTAIVLSLLTIFQGCFGGMGVIQIPKKLTESLNNSVMRFISIAAISYTATQDIETALITTVIFFGVLHLLRSDEEREEVGGFF
jgi:hypothetical protein